MTKLSDRLKGINVYLVGMMGTGKSTIGQILAHNLEYRFFDSDTVLERVAQANITEIFATEGEEVFRELETQVLSQLCAYTRSVIATGGGVVLKPKNWSYLHHGLVIWLDAPVELLYQRLAIDQTRPLLNGSDLLGKLTSLQEQRRSFYAEADLKITIQSEQTPEAIVDQILEQIPTLLKTHIL
ncbi:shikimate kinase [Gloeocapsa sp. PCC 73106]|uniref:shikimate kinase n=1 Tax=Gloeocapsa sp. PCC 73106 TaxID=102232 RepID=UPI0002AD1788|nr:shikimate kinase [Gloeocapsa sp. PCC 73106]ELR96301.1 shikimate kinase [Gloeocapsa sp. PCC 73106]